MGPTSIQINIWALPGGLSADPDRTVREAGVTGGGFDRLVRWPSRRAPRTTARTCAFHSAWFVLFSFSVMTLPMSGLTMAVAEDELAMGSVLGGCNLQM